MLDHRRGLGGEVALHGVALCDGVQDVLEPLGITAGDLHREGGGADDGRLLVVGGGRLDTHDEGAAAAAGDELARVEGGLHQDGVGTLKLLAHLRDELWWWLCALLPSTLPPVRAYLGERQGLRHFAVEKVQELGDDLSVCVRHKLCTLLDLCGAE